MIRRIVAALSGARSDLWLGSGLFGLGFAFSFLVSRDITPLLLPRETMDIWFEADVPRVFENMTERWSDHTRTDAHPLFSLITYSPVFALTLIGIGKVVAVRLVVATAAGLSLAGMYAAFRVIGLGFSRAALFTLLAGVSAGFMFWSIIPETHSLGCFSVVCALLLAAVKCRDVVVPESVDIAVSGATLSFTSTNWLFGLLAMAPKRPFKSLVIMTLASLGLVTALWAVQKSIFSSAGFFLGKGFEPASVLAPESGGPMAVATSFVYHTVVMPAIQIVDRPSSAEWPIMLTQGSAPGSAGIVGLLSVVAWTGLILVGLVTLARTRRLRPLALLIIGGLLGQLVLYVVFGNETFLYAANFLPLWIALVAVGCLSSRGRIVSVVAAALVLLSAVNNGGQLGRALSFFEVYDPMRWQGASEPLRRPDDPWLRSEPYLEMSSSPQRSFDRGYHKLGGGFSPALGSLGISLWVLDEDGGILTHDGEILESQIVQRLVEAAPERILRVETETPYYRMTWTEAGFRRWTLELSDVADGFPVALVLRSMGPAGAPVRSLEVDGPALVAGDRWRLTLDPPPLTAGVGVEGSPGWEMSELGTRALDPGGWTFGRLELEDGGRWTAELVDIRAEDDIDNPIEIMR